jgi:hypothetical protein
MNLRQTTTFASLTVLVVAALCFVPALSPAAPARGGIAFSAAAQNKPDLNGKWDLSVTTEDGPQKASMDLSVADDGRISGSIHSDYGDARISGGSLDGNKFSIRFSLTIQGNATDVNMDGTIDGDSLEGRGDAGGGAFSFTGKRAQSSLSR